MKPKSEKLDMEDMKKKLSPEQYNICFRKGTEPPFSGKYTNNKEPGMYNCVVCGNQLFSSDAKYDSYTGWPSFDQPVVNENISYTEDNSLGMRRLEILCKTCGSHLGHVFDDGPTTTGRRFCINSLALDFVPKKETA
ncbi:MAG: peptide-methionine (R)-S-oxide reductase [Candidatus Woykebacteria bacterium RBG_13_40_7b]|uniref:peptide-methionine (R)-S-oxide reductase n=1 Tax=Candidatus Woykebacteria bacterium RBG_13_40_7b TaxID=1802594 RepID=A0A1G1W5C1_9BACT|nr:MAG: peptide-methionine (R)-S-oxide reductase [Candidatus Woykebacteria bacterium RBG_13_40_7b]